MSSDWDSLMGLRGGSLSLLARCFFSSSALSRYCAHRVRTDSILRQPWISSEAQWNIIQPNEAQLWNICAKDFTSHNMQIHFTDGVWQQHDCLAWKWTSLKTEGWSDKALVSFSMKLRQSAPLVLGDRKKNENGFNTGPFRAKKALIDCLHLRAWRKYFTAAS